MQRGAAESVTDVRKHPSEISFNGNLNELCHQRRFAPFVCVCVCLKPCPTPLISWLAQRSEVRGYVDTLVVLLTFTAVRYTE